MFTAHVDQIIEGEIVLVQIEDIYKMLFKLAIKILILARLCEDVIQILSQIVT